MWGMSMENNALSKEEFRKEIIRLYQDYFNICKQLGLRHWIAFGTLLGAVRHKGFIPWDDDFDVFMPREDYESLLLYFEKNGNKIGNYSLLDPHITKHYPYCFPRFNDNSFIEIEPGKRKDYGLGLNFDIYPLDGANINDKKQIKKLLFYKKVLDLKTNYKKPKGRNWFMTLLKSIARFVVKPFSPKFTILKMHKIAKKYKFEESYLCSDIVWDPHLPLYNREWFDETVFLDFENIKCPAPKGFSNFLTKRYGDYMKYPPENERQGYHFLTIYKK